MRPTVGASNIEFSDIKSNSFHVTWTNGDGDYRILVVSTEKITDEIPLDEISYTPSGDFGEGADIPKSGIECSTPSPSPSPSPTKQEESKAYVIYDGTRSSFTVRNLKPSTDYWVTIYEYNNGYFYLTCPINQRKVTTSFQKDTNKFSITVKEELSHNPIEGAIIEVKNRPGNIVSYGDTDDKGRYTSLELEAGGYRIDVNMPGYQKQSLSGVFIRKVPPRRKDNFSYWSTIGLQEITNTTDPRLERKNEYEVYLKKL